MGKRIKDNSVLCQRSGPEKILYNIVFVVFLIQSLTFIFAVGWMIFSPLKTSDEFDLNKAFSMPAVLQWKNYIVAFEELEVRGVDFFGMIFNSVWYTGILTALSAFMPAVTGYCFSKYKFRGRDALYAVIVASMMIPLVGTTAAYMKYIDTLNFYNTPMYVVYTGLGTGLGGSFLVYYGFFKSISWSYAEAVQIDGGGPFTIFFKIMLPQAMPILLTYAITNGIMYWNEYESVLLYLPDSPTLASGLFAYKAEVARSDGGYPVYFAGLLISMVPTLSLFAIFSNKIMGSISIGGLKG